MTPRMKRCLREPQIYGSMPYATSWPNRISVIHTLKKSVPLSMNATPRMQSSPLLVACVHGVAFHHNVVRMPCRRSDRKTASRWRPDGATSERESLAGLHTAPRSPTGCSSSSHRTQDQTAAARAPFNAFAHHAMSSSIPLAACARCGKSSKLLPCCQMPRNSTMPM